MNNAFLCAGSHCNSKHDHRSPQFFIPLPLFHSERTPTQNTGAHMHHLHGGGAGRFGAGMNFSIVVHSIVTLGRCNMTIQQVAQIVGSKHP